MQRRLGSTREAALLELNKLGVLDLAGGNGLGGGLSESSLDLGLVLRGSLDGFLKSLDLLGLDGGGEGVELTEDGLDGGGRGGRAGGLEVVDGGRREDGRESLLELLEVLLGRLLRLLAGLSSDLGSAQTGWSDWTGTENNALRIWTHLVLSLLLLSRLLGNLLLLSSLLLSLLLLLCVQDGLAAVGALVLLGVSSSFLLGSDSLDSGVVGEHTVDELSDSDVVLLLASGSLGLVLLLGVSLLVSTAKKTRR